MRKHVKTAGKLFLKKYLLQECKRCRLVDKFVTHHAFLATHVNMLLNHMRVKRDAMGKMLEGWEKELKMVKRWDTDLRIVLMQDQSFTIVSDTHLLTR